MLKNGETRRNLDLAAVDRFTRTTGAIATVFARRAVGALLGRAPTAYAKVIDGQEYKIAVFNHYPEWNRIVVTGSYLDEFTALSQATQQNASASGELAATAEELGSQAGQLQQTMTFFRLANT